VAPARTEGIERAIGGDPVQPRADRHTSLELLKAAPRCEQRLLEQILGVLRGADDPVGVQFELAPVGIGQLAERVLVAGARAAVGRRDAQPLTTALRPCRQAVEDDEAMRGRDPKH
jgi:hypothetical protein